MTINKKKVVIKKYSNRRLYNTDSSSYVVLDDLFKMVKNNVDFEVKDAKTDEDLTKNVLIQIIFEQEAQGYSMLPAQFLRQVISFYGDNAATILPSYLEFAMKSFSENHEKMNELEDKNYNPMQMFEEITKKNMEIFASTMNIFYKK